MTNGTTVRFLIILCIHHILLWYNMLRFLKNIEELVLHIIFFSIQN